MPGTITEFQEFIISDIQPALSELEKIGSDESRKHLQRLVFTNLVDRFDFAVDKTLADLVPHNESLQAELANELKNSISQGDFIKIVLASKNFEGVQLAALGQLNEILSTTILRRRHSIKLRKLMESLEFKNVEMLHPRINRADGHIMKKCKQGDNKIPLSILGYADWVYSRRNAIIHGGGAKKILSSDELYLKNNFNWKPTSGVRILLATIKNVANFYNDLTTMISKKHPSIT